jgi:hypothetical protein
MSDNMDEPNIKEAIKSEDLDPVLDSVKKIIIRGERIIKQQENELSSENQLANTQLSNMNYYYTLTIVQILVVVLLGVYQLFSFRKYLVINRSI